MGDAIGDELLGLADAVIHPIDTFNNTIEAVSHPVEKFNAIKQTISDSWNHDVTNGDSYSGAAGMEARLVILYWLLDNYS